MCLIIYLKADNSYKFSLVKTVSTHYVGEYCSSGWLVLAIYELYGSEFLTPEKYRKVIHERFLQGIKDEQKRLKKIDILKLIREFL